MLDTLLDVPQYPLDQVGAGNSAVAVEVCRQAKEGSEEPAAASERQPAMHGAPAVPVDGK